MKKYTNGVTNASYTYDGNNLRQTKTVDDVTTNHIWDGADMVMETKGTTVNKYYRGVTGLAYSDMDGERRYYHKDEHGNVVAMTDNNGTVIKTDRYDAYGNRMQSNNVPTNVPKYQAYIKETEELQIKQQPDDEATKIAATPEPAAPEDEVRQKEIAMAETEYVSAEAGKVYLSDMVWKSMKNGWGPAERDMNNKERMTEIR